jgi:murein DD-endopeptidase MepM/ murein hydrolase activator NlpD
MYYSFCLAHRIAGIVRLIFAFASTVSERAIISVYNTRMPRLFAIIAALSLSACTAAANGLSWPLPGASSRPTPLHFGLYVTPDPEQNPIDPPERFTGYHVATDFETYRGERNKKVPVYAICEGPIAFSGFADGYGGLLTQSCRIDDQAVTVIYGHLDMASLTPSGTKVGTGQQIAILGAAKSEDSGDTRKHLHLGIHKGGGDVRGYVQTEAETNQFIDPMTVLRD